MKFRSEYISWHGLCRRRRACQYDRDGAPPFRKAQCACVTARVPQSRTHSTVQAGLVYTCMIGVTGEWLIVPSSCRRCVMQQGLLRKPTRCLPQQQDQSLVKQVQATSTYLVQAATHGNSSLDSVIDVFQATSATVYRCLCVQVDQSKQITPVTQHSTPEAIQHTSQMSTIQRLRLRQWVLQASKPAATAFSYSFTAHAHFFCCSAGSIFRDIQLVSPASCRCTSTCAGSG